MDGEHVAFSAALVVFGATGDLAGPKALPALAALAGAGSFPAGSRSSGWPGR